MVPRIAAVTTGSRTFPSLRPKAGTKLRSPGVRDPPCRAQWPCTGTLRQIRRASLRGHLGRSPASRTGRRPLGRRSLRPSEQDDELNELTFADTAQNQDLGSRPGNRHPQSVDPLSPGFRRRGRIQATQNPLASEHDPLDRIGQGSRNEERF